MLILPSERELFCATSIRFNNNISLQHTHLNMELVRVNSGMRTFVIENTSYTMLAGDIAIVFPLQIHECPRPFLPGTYDVISINPMRLETFRNPFFTKIPVSPILRAGKMSPRIEQLASLITDSETGDYETELLDGLSMALIAEILRSQPMQPISSSCCDPDTAYRLLHTCAEHFTESDFSMERLAVITGISTRSISRFFSERLKVSFPRFHTMLRLQLAERLLTQDRKSVTETAFACGFGSIRSFNRSFTEFYGMSPCQYKVRKPETNGEL